MTAVVRKFPAPSHGTSAAGMTSAGPRTLRSQQTFLHDMQRVLELVRQSVRSEREKVAWLEQRIIELQSIEQAYLAQRRVVEDLRADRDFWREIAETLHKR